jgi:transcriptional regulator with XRE-family HTH domain
MGEEQLDQKIGTLVRNARKVKGISQQQLGDAVNLSADMISHIEIGKRALKVSELNAFAYALEVPIMYFLMYSTANTDQDEVVQYYYNLLHLPQPLQFVLKSFISNMRERYSTSDLVFFDKDENEFVVEVKHSGLRDPQTDMKYDVVGKITIGSQDFKNTRRKKDDGL